MISPFRFSQPPLSFSRLAALPLLGVALASGTLHAQSKNFASNGTPGGNTAPATNSSFPPVKDFSTDVRGGILTVDRMVALAGLNYNIHNGFLYFTVPGVGTAIVAQERFMNAAPQKNAFHDNMLTINANGHTVELTSSGPLVPGKTAEAWVAIDPLFGAGKWPEMGFGNKTQRPYVSPGSKADDSKKDAHLLVTPPPLPKNVQPKPEIASSYTVSVPGTDPNPKK